MDKINKNFNLDTLKNLISITLCSSEETKKTLQIECEEARFALKPWPIESTIVKQLDKNICTCKEGMTAEDHDEEVATEIGKTLLYSQQLREKLAANLHREFRNARKPDLQLIYSSKPMKATLSQSKENKVEMQPYRRSNSQVRPVQTGKPDCSMAKLRRSVSATRTKEIERPKSLDRHSTVNVVVPSQCPSITNKKAPKNFILANKQSVSSMKSVKKDESKVKKDFHRICSKSVPFAEKYSKNDETEMTNELHRLIKKYTVETEVTAASLRSNCPLHAENAKHVIEEKVVTLVNAVDGLDRYGIPSQLLKILKTYHTYLRTEISDENSIHNKKQRAAADRFMMNFKRISEKNKIPNSTNHRVLLSKYSALYRDCYMDHLSPSDLRQLKTKYMSLKVEFKNCNIKDTAGESKLMRSDSDEFGYDFTSDDKNWLSNGVWNYSCIRSLKDAFGTHCTRYSERSQLIQYYEFIQTFQRKIYELELKNVLLMTVIPMLYESFSPNTKEFIEIYKMIVAITQVLNIQMPALVDNDYDLE